MRVSILAMVFLAACASPSDPITAYINGTVWTGAGADQEAFVVQGDRIVAVGTVAEAQAMATEVVDLMDAFVAPGFIDNHVHFLSGGMQLASVDLRDADSPEEFARRLGEFAAGVPAGRWILGGDWDHEMWGGALPERTWIDAVTPDNPVFVTRLDGHMGVANTAAMALAGVDAQTADVAGGTIARGQDGSPAGVFKDEAMNLIWRVVPQATLEERLEALDRAMEHAVSLGVTQVHDVGSYGGWADHETYRAAQEAGLLRVRIYNIVSISSWERLASYVAENGRGDDWLRWGGVKGFVDGSLGSTTAWFHEPYLDEPETTGLIVTDTTELRQQIVGSDAAGLHLVIHAIGDRANDWLLDTFASLPEAQDRRARIEHAQHLSQEAVGRFADLGVVPSMQPYHAVDDGRWAEKRIGAERARLTYAFRSLMDADAPLTFGSDWTVAPLDPLLGIQAAVTRATIDGLQPDGWVPEQKIRVEEALRAYTQANAWAGWQEEKVGTLEAGKLADFVILSDDPRKVASEHIADITVLRTVVGGSTKYQLDD